MPRQEFSLRGRVYIHSTYMKSTGRLVPNPNTIRRQAKRFKETGSVKNRKVNLQHHVLTEETLDEIGERLEHTPKNL